MKSVEQTLAEQLVTPCLREIEEGKIFAEKNITTIKSFDCSKVLDAAIAMSSTYNQNRLKTGVLDRFAHIAYVDSVITNSHENCINIYILATHLPTKMEIQEKLQIAVTNFNHRRLSPYYTHQFELFFMNADGIDAVKHTCESIVSGNDAPSVKGFHINPSIKTRVVHQPHYLYSVSCLVVITNDPTLQQMIDLSK